MIARSSQLDEDMSDVMIIEVKKETNSAAASMIPNYDTLMHSSLKLPIQHTPHATAMRSASITSEHVMAPNMGLQLVPEKILGDIELNDEMYFIIKWKNTNKKDLGRFFGVFNLKTKINIILK